MHHFIYATKDAWISSGSNVATTGISQKDQNYGKDPILELKKFYYNDSFDHETRILVSFAGDAFNEMSNSVSHSGMSSAQLSSSIPHVSTGLTKYYLRLYEADGTQELSSDYEIQAFPVSQSWEEGTGKFGDNPKVTTGVSWENRSNNPGVPAVSWSRVHPADGSDVRLHGGNYMTGSYNDNPNGPSSSYEASQSFSNQSPDIEMDITNIVDSWLVGSASNNGLLLRFSGSLAHTNGQILNDTAGITGSFAQLKFFSSDTHTIYPPKLEVRWDDHLACSGSNTGSMIPLTGSGQADNYLYMIDFKDRYKENEKVKFRVGARKRYIQKSFSTSLHNVSSSFIPENSGGYSIVDIATGESIVPFSSYTSMSCDDKSNYFIQWLDGFAPDRTYKILYKIKYDDGQEQIYDNDFEFIVTR